MKKIKTCIFDLDGVICDTAKYHFYAWKKLADQLGIIFTEEHNELLKGVSRSESLEILLGLSDKAYTNAEKNLLAEEKNRNYVNYISKLEQHDILPGVREFLKYCQDQEIKTALGSVSKNAMLILQRLGLTEYFDAIVDGTDVIKAKPDPEVFLKGAKRTNAVQSECVVFEDAFAGIEAARAAGMMAIGIGKKEALPNADFVIRGFGEMSPEQLMIKIQNY